MLPSSSSIIRSHNHHFDYSGTVRYNPCVSMSPNHWAFSYWKVVLESFNMHKDLTVCLESFNMRKDLTVSLESFNMRKDLTVCLESFNMRKDLTVCLESFNMHKDLTVCCAQEGKTGTDEHAQVLTLKNWKMVLPPVLNGNRTHSGPPAHVKPLGYSPCWPFALSFNVIKTILNEWFPFKSCFFFFSSGTLLAYTFLSYIQINNLLFCLISRHFKCTVPIFSWLAWTSNSCLWICKGAHRFSWSSLHYQATLDCSFSPQLKMQHQHLRMIHFALIKPSWLTGRKKANYLLVNHYTNCSENEHNLQLLSQFNRPFAQATNKHQTLTLVTAKQTLG